MSKHTPGPWIRIGTDIGTDRVSIASISIRSLVEMKGPEREANARLIAAAPELLKALKDALELIEVITPLESDTVRHARAAIAKATGCQA